MRGKIMADYDLIEIAYASDDRFAELMCVSMASILTNTQQLCRFHILQTGLSDESVKKVCSLGERFPHGQWQIHHIDAELFDGFDYSLYSIEAYFRVILPDILPDVDKIIYIDCDTVAEGDIKEIWDVQLGDNIAAAVSDKAYKVLLKRKAILDIKPHEPYFNSGVMLLDLQKMRNERFLEKFIECTPHINEKIKSAGERCYPDQDPLNYLMRGRFTLLPPRMNAQSNGRLFEEHCATLDEWADSVNDPLIIHYNRSYKPAFLKRQFIPSENWERYYDYKKLTAYYDEAEDSRRTAEYKRLEKKANCGLIKPSEYLGRNQFRIINEAAVHVSHISKGKKIAFWGKGKYLETIMVLFAANGVYADKVVDGLESNMNSEIFGYKVEKPDALNDGDYLIVLCMLKVAPAIYSEIELLGLDHYHVFNNYHKKINEPL
jgi:lipopolysaccharide biosynthesis glycosyltransferase